MSARAPEFTQISSNVLRPRLPCIGHIKLGGRGKEMSGGRGFVPTKFENFVITKRAREKGGSKNFIRDEVIHRIIGEKPTELNIRFPFAEPVHNWQTSFVAYSGARLRCQGNGERAYDRELGREIPCTCPLLKVHQGDYPKDIPRPVGKVTCKPYGVLSVLLEEAATYGGFHVLRTTSWQSISGITASLAMFREQFGRIDWIPFKLVCYPTTDTYIDDKGSTKNSTSFKVAVVLRGSMETAYQIAGAAHDRRAAHLQLASGDREYSVEEHAEQLREIAAEDEQEVGQEFHPEQQAGAPGPDAVEAEYEFLDEEAEEEEREQAEAEALCRLALEFADWEPVKINRQIAKYGGRMQELVTVLDGEMPDALAKGREEMERRAAAEPGPEDDDADDQGELL